MELKDYIENGTDLPTLPQTINLIHPIKIGKDDEITQVTFRNELDGKMLESLPVQGMKWGDFYPIISKMTGETLDTIKKMKAVDITRCTKIVAPFLSDGE